MNEPDLGDEVLISPNAPARLRPGHKAWVVALAQPNRVLITVEFEDGASAELPPDLVEKTDDP